MIYYGSDLNYPKKTGAVPLMFALDMYIRYSDTNILQNKILVFLKN